MVTIPPSLHQLLGEFLLEVIATGIPVRDEWTIAELRAAICEAEPEGHN